MLQEKAQRNTMQTWHNQKVTNNEKGIVKINCVINLLEKQNIDFYLTNLNIQS